MNIQNFLYCMVLILSPTFVFSGVKSDQRAVIQEKLDNDCTAAREVKLAPMREKYVNECVEKDGKERDYCERFYSSLGQRSGNRAPLFHDLPACVKAFEYQKSYRTSK